MPGDGGNARTRVPFQGADGSVPGAGQQHRGGGAARAPVRGRDGRQRRKPDSLFADRGYDHDVYRDQVRARGIVPAIARRGTRHGTGLGTYRWVVERTIAWLHGFRRLRIRWERRADMHEAFLKLACCLITHRQLGSLC